MPDAPGAVPTDELTTLAMLQSDPAQVYARLRHTMPVARIAALGGRILFTKAEDVLRVKTDGEHFGSSDTTTPMQRAFGGHTLMRKDGCPHLRERAAMEPALTVDHVQMWQPAFAALTDRVLGSMAGQGVLDLLPALATPISAGYVKLVLGLGKVDDAQLFAWADALVTGAMNASFDPAVFKVSDQANAEMNACFDAMIERHRAAPDGSVLSAMANQPDPIPLSQIRTNMKICIGGAVIETRDALLSTLYGLLANPAQLQSCIATGTWDAAVEEGLRWVAPIQASPRIVKKSLIMRGVLIPEGETVMAVQASANHDEDIWAHPERFDIHRPALRNHSFGDGPHQCLGGNAYRLLAGDVVLPEVFARLPDMALMEEPEVRFHGFAFRGPTGLPVRVAQDKFPDRSASG
ncbi:cytochrome P450 [Pseudorhodobacter turbinis]|uniref:Cytochrome P450 n=1 Tax=Pseudorhodobacter turbinis TaxID=2500533 RepID=A0A4P8EE26_9RHOB|nr:cytochrome P450 [Pseudorhodobacter turbinis]QCO55086.1 cytochrome P450 [Pseudorhodobacter turbinis]